MKDISKGANRRSEQTAAKGEVYSPGDGNHAPQSSEEILRREHQAEIARLRKAYESLRAECDRARHLAKHLFQMIDRETWRDLGGDDGQGHYEGDYHAARIEEEIRSWEN